MIGEYTRNTYSQQRTNDDWVRSTKINNFVFTTPQNSNTPCYSANGPRNTRTMASSELNTNYDQTIDIENMLRGLGTDLSRNIDVKTFLNRDLELSDKYKNLNKRETTTCSTFLDQNYTRLNSNQKIQELAFNRYEFPIIDPINNVFNGIQGHTDANHRNGVSTRMDMRAQLDEKNKLMRKMANNISKTQ
jgi:hypothetical protein